MQRKYHIDSNIDIPIYRQLADEIIADIRQGKMAYGERLPTVKELAKTLNIAIGTIKRCYDELEADGFIEKAQGRGSFVSYKAQSATSRKDAAMEAIDKMLDRLEELNFSNAEASIYVNLKLRERENDTSRIRVAAVASCREELRFLTQSLRKLGKLDIYSYLKNEVMAYPYNINDENDLIVASDSAFEEIRAIMTDKNKVLAAALVPEAQSAEKIIRADNPVCIETESDACFAFFEKICAFYGKNAVQNPGIKPEELELSLDRGSEIYIKDRIEKLAEQKMI